jgi:hypothetical protein
MVDPTAPSGVPVPRISVEHPAQVIVAHDRGNPLRRLAALKVWKDLDGSEYAYLFLPDRVVRYKALVEPQGGQSVLGVIIPSIAQVGSMSNVVNGRWTREGSQTHRLGAVPVVPLVNNAQMLQQDGVSDLKPAISLNDAANKFFTDMLVASEFAAYPQRVIMGLEVPDDPVTGQPMIDQVAGVSRTWIFEGEDISATQFQAADLNNYVNAIEATIQHLAAQTRTPPHYLLAKLVNLSAEALQAAETGLVSRVRRKHIDFADGWEEAMRLAFRATTDDRRAAMTDAETIWADPETRSPSIMADVLVKLRAVGFSYEKLWEIYGLSPQEIEDMKAQGPLPATPPNGTPSPNGNGATPTTAETAGTP